jgi:hypothetical protein
VFEEAIANTFDKGNGGEGEQIKIEDFRDEKNQKDGEVIMAKVRAVVSAINSKLSQIQNQYHTQLEVVITDPVSSILSDSNKQEEVSVAESPAKPQKETPSQLEAAPSQEDLHKNAVEKTL